MNRVSGLRRDAATLWPLLAVVAVALALAVYPPVARGQSTPCGSEANVDVYGLCNGNSGSTTQMGSTSRVDASVFCSQQGCLSTDDICAVIADALAQLPAAGGIVDARGVNTSKCANSPFGNGGTPPATVLLPGIAINVQTTWTLPNQTRIVGEGRGQTILSATTSPAFNGSTMIKMGSASTSFCPEVGSSYICTGIVVADLTLEGNRQTTAIDGIDNTNGGRLSYVENVIINDIGGIGLKIVGAAGGGTAFNSGPYSDLHINSANTSSGNR